MSGVEIFKDNLSDGKVIALLEEHRQEMFKHSPPESVHALDTIALHAANITFWSAYCGGVFAGCGALKELTMTHGELKSMKTHTRYLRRGVAAALLDEILREAKQRGYTQVSLETGTMAAFEPARKLYMSNGFAECLPFADYFEDPNSVCMTTLLSID